jgi:hypothetical protein
MGRGILIRIIGILIFHNKIQQSGINITRFRTSGGRSNRSANKIIVVGIGKITQLGVPLSHRDYANKIAHKNRSDEKTMNEKDGE